MEVKVNGEGPILMVDDDTDSLRLASLVFRESKLKNPLVTMETGTEFMQYLDQVASGKKTMPALVLLDINMPVCNGFEVLRQVRERAVFHHIPIILMFTTSNDADDMRRAMEGGANGYKVKPFSLEEYLRFANSLVNGA